MTFITDLDDLIRYGHGDLKKLREIRDTVRHDNFITTDDKNYVESLITTHLKNQPLDKTSSTKQSDAKIKLQPKLTTSSSSKSDSAFNFSSNKKIGIFGGVAAAIAIIAVIGFSSMDQGDVGDSTVSSTITEQLLMNIDQSTYQRADIISISGDAISNAKSIELSIENNNGVKIWHEIITPNNDGTFSTLVIAGGGGWENDGMYTLNAEQDDSDNKIEFKFVA